MLKYSLLFAIFFGNYWMTIAQIPEIEVYASGRVDMNNHEVKEIFDLYENYLTRIIHGCPIKKTELPAVYENACLCKHADRLKYFCPMPDNYRESDHVFTNDILRFNPQ